MIAISATPAGTIGALASLGAGSTDAEPAARTIPADAAGQFAAMLQAAQCPTGPRGPRIALSDLADAGLLPDGVAGDTDALGGETHIEEFPSAPAAFVPMGGAPVIDLSTIPHDHIATFAADDAETVDESAVAGDDEHEARATEEPRGARPTSARDAAAARSAVPAVTDRSTAALDAVFAARLSRVIERMEAAGYDVSIAETTRSSARQDALYAQGRSTEGPVVTWTRNSRHLTGHAADLVIDGKSDGPGYALLQRLAREEGLRTLGAKDPGHLELPRTTVDAREGATARRGTSPSDAGSPARPATLSALSRPSQLAQLSGASARGMRAVDGPATATPAAGPANGAPTAPSNVSVARAATTAAANPAATDAVRSVASPVPATGVMPSPARRGRSASGTASAVASTTASGGAQRPASWLDATVPSDETAAPTLHQGDAQGSARGQTHGDATRAPGRDATSPDGTMNDADLRLQNGAGTRAERATRLRRATETARALVAETRSGALEALRGAERGEAGALGLPFRTSASHATGTAAPLTPAGALAAERVAALLAARDAAPAPTVGELRLALDPARDGLSEVRLAMSGAALDATLRTTDAGIARGLQGEIAGLARALERSGFESARVQVALDAVQQARAATLDTVGATDATARERGIAGGRDERQGGAGHGGDEALRDQRHQRRFGRRGN